MFGPIFVIHFLPILLILSVLIQHSLGPIIVPCLTIPFASTGPTFPIGLLIVAFPISSGKSVQYFFTPEQKEVKT